MMSACILAQSKSLADSLIAAIQAGYSGCPTSHQFYLASLIVLLLIRHVQMMKIISASEGSTCLSPMFEY
jgi:hypothetical protein